MVKTQEIKCTGYELYDVLKEWNEKGAFKEAVNGADVKFTISTGFYNDEEHVNFGFTYCGTNYEIVSTLDGKALAIESYVTGVHTELVLGKGIFEPEWCDDIINVCFENTANGIAGLITALLESYFFK